MGILNLTPDSFSGDGLNNSSNFHENILKQALKIERDGADILDIGAESTRPGAEALTVKEELKRLIPVLKKIRKKTKLPISVDTQKPEVAKQSLEEGVNIINDVSFLREGTELVEIVQNYKAGYILMHARGTSKTMNSLNHYRNINQDIVSEFKETIKILKAMKFPEKSLVLDLGIGFAKKGIQNMKLLRNLESFKKLGYPICIGISRKSFIGDIVGDLPENRDFGTTALHTLMVERGVHILRVHSVQAAKQATLVTRSFLK